MKIDEDARQLALTAAEIARCLGDPDQRAGRYQVPRERLSAIVDAAAVVESLGERWWDSHDWIVCCEQVAEALAVAFAADRPLSDEAVRVIAQNS